jgi:hypothetical protein
MEGILIEVSFPLYITYAGLISAVYSIPHLNPPNPLVLLDSKHLSTLYDIQNCDSKLPSGPQIR